MDLDITDDERTQADAFERFCQNKIAPRAQQADEEQKLPRENLGDLKEMGFFDLFYPAPHGTYDAPGGSTWITRAMAEESLAKACASTFLSAGATIGLCGAPIFHFGTAEQKERWLDPLIRLEKMGCFGLTEPGAGTDAASIKTRARRDGSKWLLSGEKALITNAPHADVGVIMAVTDPAAGVGGVTMFGVDLHKSGVTKSAPYKKLGLRASATGGIVFDDVELKDDDVIGEVGQGFIQAMQTLELGRVGMCHFGIGIAEAAYDAARKYAQERTAFGRPIARLQAVHFKIADMKIEIDAARLMARQCAWRKSLGEYLGARASIAKTYACEMAVRVCDDAVQIHGGWGYTCDFPVERYLRDARLGPLGEGTSEIQRELIARELLDG
jgi:alkylation response protein AidB-like acyl-CoA dehydrogenase